MGRKSSAKSQTRPSSGSSAAAPPDEPKRSFSPLVVVVLIVVAAVVGVFVATRSAQTTPPAPEATAAAPAQAPVSDEPPASVKFGPHKQDRLPPLPVDPMPARPMEVVRAAYAFAAEHPEILAYVPCYCGCERQGHRGNDDCFVQARSEKGDVTQWEPHGMT
jgi:hypothetical protein